MTTHSKPRRDRSRSREPELRRSRRARGQEPRSHRGRSRGQGPRSHRGRSRKRLAAKAEVADQVFRTTSVCVETVQSEIRLLMREDGSWGTSTILCPTAGDGRLSRGLFPGAKLFDRNPAARDVAQQEFDDLVVRESWGDVIVLENPPFNATWAVRFFNTFANFPRVNRIAIIFPERYRGNQWDLNGREVMNPYFHCAHHVPLPYGSFESAAGTDPGIQCSFQVWDRRDYERPPCDVYGGKNCGLPEGDWDELWVAKCKTRAVTATGGGKKASPVVGTNGGNHVPMYFRRGAVADPVGLATAAHRKAWTEYPGHSGANFVGGLLANAARGLLAEGWGAGL